MSRYLGYSKSIYLWALRRILHRQRLRLDIERENALLRRTLNERVEQEQEDQKRKQLEYLDRVGELIEARQMAGTGPWKVGPKVIEETDRLIDLAASAFERNVRGVPLRETTPAGAVGATSDIELALQNIEWRREVNLSWMEFSRWGIQQIILISRLHYVKNPWIQRGINIVSAYIFGRGVELMSEDDDANAVLEDFFHRNKTTLGQASLVELQKRLMYDGQVFFCFFSDKASSGAVNVRTIDATEISEIITDPDDTDKHWLYKREWTQKVFNLATGEYTALQSMKAYYPAIGFVPNDEQKGTKVINGAEIKWDNPILMVKGGTGVSKWHFDTPRVYAALDWAKAGRKWLEACATVNLALAQFSMILTTKGGQQALAGAKQQLSTTVGLSSNLWDTNPTAVNGSIFASGPGTTLQAFKTQGAGGDPNQVAEYRNMTACVLEIPPTFLGDMDTSNLATATSLDRPTELSMLVKQEVWREVFLTIGTFVLNVSQGAAKGKLREVAGGKKKAWRVIEAKRRYKPNGTWVYEASGKKDDSTSQDLELKCIFPAIREGDLPVLVKAIAEAMTLDNKGGQVVGIDEKVGVGLLYEQLGVENPGDILEEQYPEGEYDPDRTKVPLAAPIPKAMPSPGGQPQLPNGSTVPPDTQPADGKPPTNREAAAARLIRAVEKADLALRS